jgi:hypothetical protein
MNNDQLHKDAVKLLIDRKDAKLKSKHYNQRRKQATADLQPIIKQIWEALERNESVGGFTTKKDWAKSQSITTRQCQRIIEGYKPQRRDVALKVGKTVVINGAKVVLTLAMLEVIVGGIPTTKAKIVKAKPVKSVAKRTKHLPETTHFHIESNKKRGGAHAYNIVRNVGGEVVWRGDSRGFGSSYGDSPLDNAKSELHDQENDFIAQQEGAAEDIEIGHTCDHGKYYHNAEGDFQEADPHSINPACDKCTQAAAV